MSDTGHKQHDSTRCAILLGLAQAPAKGIVLMSGKQVMYLFPDCRAFICIHW
jgi:hypothetical protein